MPEARVVYTRTGGVLSSRERAVEIVSHDRGTIRRTVWKHRATRRGDFLEYDFGEVHFRYGNGVVYVVEDRNHQNKQVWIAGAKVCEGVNLKHRSFQFMLPSVIRTGGAAKQTERRKREWQIRRKKGMISVLCVISCTEIGGAEIVLKRLLAAYDRDAFSVHVAVTHNRGPLHAEYAESCDSVEYAPDGARYAGAHALEDWLIAKAKAEDYDVVHFFNLMVLYGCIPRLRNALPNAKIIVSLLSDIWYHRDHWKLEVEAIRAAQPYLWAFTTDAHINRRLFPEITVLRDGVPVETFSPAPKKPNTVAWVSRFTESKKPLLVAEMARRLPGYAFTVVGDREGPYAEKLRAQKLPNLQVRTGLREREVADLLAETQYFVFTSRTEAMPISVLEAMSAACCVVAEPVGDIPNVVRHGETGYVTEGDPVKWVAENLPRLNLKVCAAARRKVLRDHNLDNMAKQYEFLWGQTGSHGGQARIAFLWGVLPHHGIGFWDTKVDSHQQAIADLSRDNVVQVFAPTDGPPQRKILNGQNVQFYLHGWTPDLLASLEFFQPDMIFMNMFGEPSWPAVARAFPRAWKALMHFGSENLRIPWAEDVDLFIVQQEYMRGRVAEANGVPGGKVVAIPFCVEQWLFKPREGEREYTGIMVADFRKHIKRQHLLIEAWRDVPGKLLLVGPYERSIPAGYHDECKRLARNLGVEDRVVFVDGYPHEDLPELISRAKIGFLTSSHEAGSRALMEMLACGLPCVVTSDCEGNVHMIRNGVDGWIADPTPQGIASAANALLRNYEAMGAEASKRIHREHPYHRMSEAYRHIVTTYRPEVSVITTSMNRGRFLARCLDSVAQQRGTKVNHVVMDGGSTDGSIGLLEKHRGSVHAYIRRDRGQTDAILRALDFIEEQFPQTGYVGWLNADDFYDKSWLQESLAVLRNAPADVAMTCSDARQVNEDGSHKAWLDYTKEPYVSLRLLAQRGSVVIQPTVLIRLEALRGIRAKTGRAWDPGHHYCQDLELWIRFLRNGWKIRKLDGVKVTANLRSHAGQMSHTHAEQQWAERDRLLRGVCEELGIPILPWVRG